MGNALSSRSKKVDHQPQSKSSNFSCSTASSERTMVQQPPFSSSPDNTSTNVDETSIHNNNKRKPSIMPNNKFFDNMRNITSKTREKKTQHFLHPVHVNNTSLAKRKAKYNNNNKRKKKTAVVTKSIIGRPTNFQHLNSSTNFDHMQLLNDDDEEAAKVAAQMMILSALIKPLPMDDMVLVIPPRTSSYGNSIYVKENPINKSLPKAKGPSYPSIKKNKKKVGMKNGSIPIRASTAARKRVQQQNNNYVRASAAAAAAKKVSY